MLGIYCITALLVLKDGLPGLLLSSAGRCHNSQRQKSFFEVAQIYRMNALQSLEAMPVFDKERS